jgi:hypothetical protein
MLRNLMLNRMLVCVYIYIYTHGITKIIASKSFRDTLISGIPWFTIHDGHVRQHLTGNHIRAIGLRQELLNFNLASRNYKSTSYLRTNDKLKQG